jgi:uncharacterized protein YegJ (DUF2314 family)
MRALLSASLAALVLGAVSSASVAAAPVPASQAQGDRVVDFGEEDAEMNAAIASARMTLPLFWKHLEASPLTVHYLKVGFSTPDGGHEHTWVKQMHVTGGDKVTALLANKPQNLPGLSMYVPVTFTQDQISDWAYEKNGKFYGHYTTRVVIKHIDPAEAASMRATLSENPVETSGQ